MKTITVDTNVLFRVFFKDGSPQWKSVAELFEANRVVIIPTVLLETEWVMRSIARFPRARISELFHSMLTSSDFIVTDRERIENALRAFDAGMDFADALHLCLSDEATTFVTFDRDLKRRARRLMPNASVELADTL